MVVLRDITLAEHLVDWKDDESAAALVARLAEKMVEKWDVYLAVMMVG